MRAVPGARIVLSVVREVIGLSLSLGIFLTIVIGCTTPPSQATHETPQPSTTILSSPSGPSVSGRLIAVKDGSLVELSGGILRTLASGDHFDGPAYSPDGQRIAVSIVGQNHSDLVLLDRGGHRVAQLTTNWAKTRIQDSAWARHPAWSLDGRRIAYVSDRTTADLTLWTISADGKDEHAVISSPAFGGLDWPSWSHSGNELALTYFERNISQIMLSSATLGPITKLTDHQDGAYDPAWSPAGDNIAYVARQGNRSDIWMMADDGSHATRLTDMGTARTPAWSPSGDQIAFLADRGQGFDLYVTGSPLPDRQLIPTSDVKRLTNGQKFDAAAGVTWSR